MSLADSSLPVQLLSFFSPKKPAPPPSSLTPAAVAAFEEALIIRLRTLLPIAGAPSSISLAWLSQAAGVVSLTMADAESIVSDVDVSVSDRDSIDAHLGASVALLDAANAITSEIDRHLRHRLLLRLALRLLRSGSPGKARSYIADWEKPAPAATSFAASRPRSDLIRNLTPVDPPRGKVSAVRRVTYAVEAVSCLVAGAIVAAFSGGTVCLSGKRVSGGLPWGEAYNEVARAVVPRVSSGCVEELAAVEEEARNLARAIDAEEAAAAVERNAAAAESAVEAVEERLKRLAGAVDEMFHATMDARHAALDRFWMVPQKRKGNGYFCGETLVIGKK